jgi:glycosyltransferase involved in cell wall biosynthesis
LFAKVDYFLAIGRASRRFYLKHGVPERKLVDAPYGVDNEFFRSESGKIRGLRDQGFKGPKDKGEQGAPFEWEHFDILTDQQRAIREEWKIPLDAKVVMFCGKFVGKKRPLDVVEAVRLLAGKAEPEPKAETGFSQTRKYRNTEIRPYHLLFVGSGELGEELRAACDVRFDAEDEGKRQEAIGTGLGEVRCNKRGTGEISSLEPLASSRARETARPPASFAGFLNQSQISKAYAVADVVVLPSEAWETWGLVVNEATAAGLPTVVSDRCGCSEDFAAKNPYTRVFPMGDVAAMARAIKEVLALEAKPEDVTKLAEAFSPRITAEAVAQCLRGRRSEKNGPPINAD